MDKGRLQIEQRRRQQYRENVQRKIREHYFKKAEKTVEKLWKECKRTTGHTFHRDQNQDNPFNVEFKPEVCVTCGRPRGYNSAERTRKGIAEVAKLLREADRKAGVEYIPT